VFSGCIPAARIRVFPLGETAHEVETFTHSGNGQMRMSSGQNSGGLMSSAGLVRYFDAEDRNAIRVDPKTIVAFGVIFGVAIQVLNLLAL
jgi:preprotein translocase subunit Sec61beta